MTEASTTPADSVATAPIGAVKAAVLLGGLVFAAALFGIWSRPIGFLSVFWPANPLLLGALLYRPKLLQVSSALAVLIGYVAADLLTGSRLDVAIPLSMANMLGVAVGWLLMRKRGQRILFMQSQSSALLIFFSVGAASLVSAAIGAPVLTRAFDTPPMQAFAMWLSGEWLNYMILLPPILAWPTRHLQKTRAGNAPSPWAVLPVLLVVALEVASFWLGGPGALAFSLPALLWCALSYRIFTLTVITSLLCISKVIAISLGSFDFTPAHFLESVSIRIGLSMLILGPLSVASAHASRTELMQRLKHAVNHDFLTDVLARSAFIRYGQRVLARCAHEQLPVAVLMLDLDHFKRVNDRYGHAGGDLLLRRFSEEVSRALRPQDIVGRLGGEEFAVLLPQVNHREALEIASRLNQITRQLQVPLGSDVISATVSIGLAFTEQVQPGVGIDCLLQQADQALYQAKAAGRDRFMEAASLTDAGSTAVR